MESLISDNLLSTLATIDDACRRSGRDRSTVQLVAVTKYAKWEWVQALSNYHRVFGENRPQQLSERKQLLPDIQWHLIGQLQRNKAKLAIESSALIHSVDSERLMQKIDTVAGDLNRRATVLAQVNISGENSKSGFVPADLRGSWADVVAACENVDVAGLMTMAPATDNQQVVRSVFAELRQLRDTIQEDHGVSLPELSMGMSGDFEIAVEEGATLVRIGSRLFEGLDA